MITGIAIGAGAMFALWVTLLIGVKVGMMQTGEDDEERDDRGQEHE